MRRYAATTTQGVEPDLAAELTELGARSVRANVGRVHFEADEATALRVLHAGRVVDRVYEVLAAGDAGTFDAVLALARDVDWPRVFPSGKAFAVRGTRVGEHAFTSVNAAGAVGHAVIEAFEAAGRERPTVNLNVPQVELKVHVRDDEGFVAVNLAGASLHHRGWRVVSHLAPLKPTLAAALLRMSGWARLGHPPLLDPTTGSGTLAVEAALLGRGVPPGRFRLNAAGIPLRRPGEARRERADAASGNAAARTRGGVDAAPESGEAAWFHATHPPTGHLFQHLHGYDRETWRKVVEEVESRARDAAEVPVVARDAREGEVEAARRNAVAAGVADTVDLAVADAGARPRTPPRVVVANPPYGVRMGSRRAVARANEGLARLVREAADHGPVTAVFITGDGGLRRAMEVEPAERRRVLYGALSVDLLRYELS